VTKTALAQEEAVTAARGVAAVLGSLIGVNQRAARASSRAHRYEGGIEHQVAMDRGASGPAQDLAREQI
jgi:hypothetical protein